MNVIVVASRPAGHHPTHPNLRISGGPEIGGRPHPSRRADALLRMRAERAPDLLVAHTLRFVAQLRFAAQPTFCPTKSTRSRRVTSGANQKNSGPSRKNDNARSGRPAESEGAVAETRVGQGPR